MTDLARAPLSFASTDLIGHTDDVVTARERARAQFTEDLLAAARVRLATDGAAGLSLRAVARDLGVASSAVYRYVPSRDALLTLLIIEAYDAVGTVCEQAASAQSGPGRTPAAILLDVARAFRRWALAHRNSFELVYGTPVPGYAAPQDTVPHALRIWSVLIGVVLDAAHDGSLHPTGPALPGGGVVDPAALEFGRQAAEVRGVDPSAVDETAVARTFTLFATIIGAVSAELFGHLHRAAADYARSFDAMVATAAAGVGLHIDLGAVESGG